MNQLFCIWLLKQTWLEKIRIKLLRACQDTFNSKNCIQTQREQSLHKD